MEWIKTGSEEERGDRLLREVRFGLIDPLLLKEVGLKAAEMLPEHQETPLRNLVRETLALYEMPFSDRKRREGGLLGRKAFAWRKGVDIPWGS